MQLLADSSGHGVEGLAHIAGKGNALVLVGPGCKDEEASFSTRLKILMSWFRKLIEAPRRKKDDGQMGAVILPACLSLLQQCCSRERPEGGVISLPQYRV